MNNEIPVTWKIAIQIWWSITWRFIVYLLPLSFLLSLIPTLINYFTGHMPFSNNPLGNPLHIIFLPFVVAIFAVKQTLKLKWSTFHIAVKSND